MLALDNFKLILSSNIDEGMYLVLREAILENINPKSLCYVAITRDECPHLSKEEVSDNYGIVKAISGALLGEDYAETVIEGNLTLSGQIFDFESVKDSFDTYDLYCSQFPPGPIRILTVDPSQTKHPFGIFVGDFNRATNELRELESWEFVMGKNDPRTGQKVSADWLENFIIQKCIEHDVYIAFFEKNCNGAALASKVKSRKAAKQVYCTSWGGKGKANSHENHIWAVRYVMDKRLVYLKNPRLKTELSIYDPSKDKEQHKGDLADAFIWAVWFMYGGFKFFKRILPELKHLRERLAQKDETLLEAQADV